MNAYSDVANKLRVIHQEIIAWLTRAEAHAHKNMKQVAPGIWIHNDYRDLSEALNDLQKTLL